MNRKRNRHTGRINAAKRDIIEKGERFVDSRGVEYAGIKPNQFGGGQIVRIGPRI